MKTDSEQPQDMGNTSSPGRGIASLRVWIQIAAGVIGLISVGTLLSIILSPGQQKPAAVAKVDQPVERQSEAVDQPMAASPSLRPQQQQRASITRSASSSHTSTLPVSPALRQLVTSLANLQTGTWSEDQIAAWKQNLQQLIKQGADAVPAIAEFLAKNVDMDFGPQGKQVLGYTSVRAAMIDALAQIGGPVAEVAMADLLTATADPREIAIVAQHLEKQDPGVHQAEALDAVRQTLAMAREGNLAGQDVAPLFEVFQKFGGPGAVAELEAAAKNWNFYAVNALARLPDGAGVPALEQMAAGGGLASDAKAPALEMLAQVATQYDDARTALVNMARQSQLTPYDWLVVAPYLVGEQIVLQNSAFDSNSPMNPNDVKATHISANQNFYMAPLGAMTIEQIEQRKALIDELLSATSDPAAIQTLQKSKAVLSQRLTQVVATQ